MSETKEKVLDLLREYTGFHNIYLTQRGNKAIRAALAAAKNLNPKSHCLVPDQGGWITYQQYPKKLQLWLNELKTDYGIINLEDLKSKTNLASSLIYSNPAGYFAEQPIEEIYEICKDKCVVILDATGSLGDNKNLGKNADIIVGSFGKWKPVNLTYGGFIAFKSENAYELHKEIIEDLSFDEKYLEKLFDKLKNVKKRYKKFYDLNRKIKEDLKKHDIIHPEKKGINVIVKFSNEEERVQLLNYCKENELEYTFCPRYIRVNENAISIEVKRVI